MRAKEISLATPFYVVNRKRIVIVYPTSVSYTTNSAIRVMLSGQYWDVDNKKFNNGYKTGLELDRIDNNGNYEPGNCRFVTHAENNRNKRMRCDNKTGYIGVTFHKQNKCYTYEIQIDGIRYRKSGYETPQLAYQAREQKLLELKNML